MRNMCSCPTCSGGLGFAIDWAGLATNAVKAYTTVQTARTALVIQRAQQDAALRAQAAEIQAMLRRQTQTVAAPVSSVAAVPRPQPALPSWAVPAALAGAVLLLLRR